MYVCHRSPPPHSPHLTRPHLARPHLARPRANGRADVQNAQPDVPANIGAQFCAYDAAFRASLDPTNSLSDRRAHGRSLSAADSRTFYVS